jgi:hypothetical protein
MRLMFRSQVLVGDRVGAGKQRTGGQGEIRSPKSEKRVTTDYPDFTDVFEGCSKLKVAQIFNLPYRRIASCRLIGLAQGCR